jgi:broad specificity phosphatase PhoE
MTDAVESGILAGRRHTALLTERGRRSATSLAKRLSRAHLDAVYSSPLERTVATAEMIAEPHGLSIISNEAFDEIDMGDWTGVSITEVKAHPMWAAYNQFRSATRPPGGETMLEVQRRSVMEMLRLRAEHAGRNVAIVSHADVVKAMIGYFAGIPIDLLSRIEIDPASVSVVETGDDFVRVIAVNAREWRR